MTWREFTPHLETDWAEMMDKPLFDLTIGAVGTQYFYLPESTDPFDVQVDATREMTLAFEGTVDERMDDGAAPSTLNWSYLLDPMVGDAQSFHVVPPLCRAKYRIKIITTDIPTGLTVWYKGCGNGQAEKR